MILRLDIYSLAFHFPRSVQKQVIPALKKILEDEKDADVRFFAQDALRRKFHKSE